MDARKKLIPLAVAAALAMSGAVQAECDEQITNLENRLEELQLDPDRQQRVDDLLNQAEESRAADEEAQCISLVADIEAELLAHNESVAIQSDTSIAADIEADSPEPDAEAEFEAEIAAAEDSEDFGEDFSETEVMSFEEESTKTTVAAELETESTIESQSEFDIDESGEMIAQVDQPAAEIDVHVPAAEIEVESKSPKVTVEVEEPEVRVNQPEPKVAVNQPEPEVTVEQDEPKVEVAQADPEVTVEESADTEVEVDTSIAATDTPEEGELADADDVMVDSTVEGEADTSIAASTEPADSPEEGELDESELFADPTLDTETDSSVAATTEPDAIEDPEELEDRINEFNRQVERDQALAGAAGDVVVEEIIDSEVIDASGESIASVEKVVVDPQSRELFAVVSHGGIFGIGDKDVVVPLSEFSLNAEGELVYSGSKEQMEAMASYEEESFEELEESRVLTADTAEPRR